MFDEKDLIVKDDRIYYENDGRVLAEIDFEDIGEKRMNIGHTFVHESLRGQGVGVVLVNRAVRLIKEKGYTVQATCSYAKKCIEENNLDN